MKKFVIYISLALTAMLSAAGTAEAQVADFVPYTRHSIDSDIYNLRFAIAPDFDYAYDDYIQYAPAAVMLGLKACGYQGRTKWGGMLVSDAFSVGIMTVTVRGIKYLVNRSRPYGGDHSFPSGHTATAFMSATLLHKEYG